MTDFRPEPGSSVFCRTDFTFQTAANIDFHDAAWRQVPFHLSLRPKEGRVVVNRRDAAGWRREIVLDHPLDPAGGTVELRFHTGAVTVWLDGQRLARFDRFPRPDRNGRLFLRRGFPDLGDIAHVTVEGAVLPESLRLRGPRDRVAPAPVRVQAGGLALTDRLEVEGPEGRATGLRLPGADVLALAPVPGRPGRVGAVLPGRIWAGLAADEAAALQPLDAAGAPSGPALVVTRADLAAALAQLAGGDRLDHDDLAALQAVEHARHAGALPGLPARVQAALWQAAGRFGLTAFLAQGAPAGGARAPAAPRGADARLADRLAEDAVCRTVALALRADPQADPGAVLARALADHPAPAAMDKRLMRLAEPFCARGAFGPLWAQAQAAGLDFSTRPWGDDRWTNSVLMPFLLMAGRAAELPKLLWWLAEPRDGWLVTPTIAWTVQAALDRPDLPEALAEELIYAWIGFLDANSETYAGRSACAALRAVSVRLVAEGARRAYWLRAPLRDMALRVHGLDPAFWDGLTAAGMPDDPLLAEARAAFAGLHAAICGPDPQGAAAQAAIAGVLDLFGQYRNRDVARFRRILLGPAGVVLAPGQGPDLAALRGAGGDVGAALLRHLMFPDDRLAAPSDPGLLHLAAEAVAPAWDSVAIPPMAGLQRDLGRRLPALIGAARAGQAPDAARLDRLVADLGPLASARSRWLGLGLGLTLIEALADGPAPCAEAADRLAGHLVRLAEATAPAERPARDAAPAVAAARARAAARRGPLPPALARALAPFTAPSRSPDLPALAPWPDASPLHDLLVVVFSCRAYLDTRIPALRAGWLGDLAAMGIPYVVAVGGAAPAEANTRQGDVVFLDAPDDYEGLPAKMLAMIAWVQDHTPFARAMKIDDDCFVDAQALFGSLQTLKYDYLGRPLTRVRGQMDRAWHNAKATSARGRLELDKSPEPSSYADGGSGYVLSRRAMAAARTAAASPEGRRLTGLSFMEDKLLGDLLAMEGIRVAGEGWRVAVERRTGASGLTVPQWENGPRPFAGAGIAVAHLDTHLTQPQARAGAAHPLPRRGKIWPSFQALRFGAGSNTLDLISPQARVQAVAAAPVAVVAVMRNEAFMLPAFLDHYRRLGAGGFLIADNGSDDGTLELLLDQPDVAVFSVDTPYSRSMYGVAWQEALLAAFRPGRWTLVADADELLVWDETATGDLPAVLAGADFAQADAVRTYMLDMYPEGPLSAATFAGNPFHEAPCTEAEPFLGSSFAQGPFSDAVTWTSGLRHRLIPGSRPELFVAQKRALLRYRPWMRLTEGLHYVGGAQPAPRGMLLAHFKYNAAFRAKAEAEVARRQHFNDAEEYRKYLALVSEGRETIHDPALSVHWTASAFVRHLFATGQAPGPGGQAADNRA